MQAKEKEKAALEETKDDSSSKTIPMTRDTDFCVAFYQAEYKDLRQKIIKQVFKDMSSKWNRNHVIYPLSPCDNI